MSPDHAPPEIPGLQNPEVIGQGGFGTVYSVDEPEFGRKVAVKVLQDRLDGDDVRRAFARECQAMGALSGHPHIVTVHRGGTTPNDEPYIVMDLMSAGSLADRIAREGPLRWAEVLEISVTVAGALETAHRAGILHLDLKPANLLVSRYGEPKLGDFGISRLPGVTETTGGRIRASAAYTAPERLLEGTSTPAADLYGLGATMFTLLTGRPAFVGAADEELLATVARIVRDPVPDLRPRGVPDPVALVVERLMAKSPGERYASASDAAAALQAAQRALGRSVTRPVIEGETPGREDSMTWPAHPAARTGPPPGPLVPEFAALGPSVPSSGAPTTATPYGNPTLVGPPVQFAGPPPGPPLHPPPGPPPGPPTAGARRRPGLVAGVVAAVLVVVLAVVGGAYLINRPTGRPLGTVAAGTTTARAATTTPQTTGSRPPGTAVRLPTATADGGVVALANDVTHPATRDVRAVLQGYVSGINDARYADAFAYFSPDSDSFEGGLAAWTAGQSTTTIDGARIVAVRDSGPDTVEVEVTFTSRQAAQYGPQGQTCTNWDLAYEMVGPGPGWLIRKARALSSPRPC